MLKPTTAMAIKKLIMERFFIKLSIAKMVDTYRETGPDYSEKRWFRTIEHKLQNLNLDISDEPEKYSYISLADKLLGNIAKDSLKSVKDTLDRELNNGEYTQIGGVD